MSPSNSKLKSQLLLKALYSTHKILDFLEFKKKEGERRGNFRYWRRSPQKQVACHHAIVTVIGVRKLK